MMLAKDFEDFVQLLNKFKVQYMVIGGYALAFHGKPRHTGDLDIWINNSEENAVLMLKVVEEFGMGSLGFTTEDFMQKGYITQLGYPPLRIDILNEIDGVDFHDAYPSRLKFDADGLEIDFIGLSELLKNKKAAGRKQDVRDVKEIKKMIPPQRPKGRRSQ